MDAVEVLEEREELDDGLPRSLRPGHWLSRPLRHPQTHTMLLPVGTVFTRDTIDKVRLMDVELAALMALGPGMKQRPKTQVEITADLDRQRTTIERIAEAFGSMRDICFGLFCVSAGFAFVSSNGTLAIVAGAMLLAMLLNAWLTITVLQRLSALNRTFSGVAASRVRAC